MSYVRESAASLQQKINTVQDTLQQIEVIKKKLNANAMQTKSHIQTAVSRQLESLRNREVWLFEQVQLLQATKQETLAKQTDDLWQTLGNLESCLRCVASLDLNTTLAQHHLTNLNRTIEECITRFESLELTATENPYLSFKADVAALRTCIHKFGAIETKDASAAELVFGGVLQGSASLPRAFEEYGDDEHHVFYKPLEHAQIIGNIGTITLKVPNANLRPEDWLFIPTDITPVPPPPVLPPFQVNVDEWLVQKRVTASPSIHQWLKDLQSECDLEEESYDVVAGNPPANKHVSTTTHSDIEVISHCDVIEDLNEPMDVQYQYFVQVLQAPDTEWLIDGDISSLTCPYLKMKYFSEISNNLNDWLQHYQQERQDEDKDVCCDGNHCGTSSQQLDIENLHQLSCVHETVDGWLLPSITKANVAELCRANEPCHTFSDCVSPENCCTYPIKHAYEHKPLDKNYRARVDDWLTKTVDATQFDSDNSDELQKSKLVSDSMHKWLISSSIPNSLSSKNTPKFPPFQDTGAGLEWLKSSKDLTSSGSMAQTSSYSWLSTPSVTQSGCSQFSPFSVGSASSDWLKQEKDDKISDKNDELHWLLHGIDKNETSQVDFTAFQPANEETFMETSWLLKPEIKSDVKPIVSKSCEVSKSKVSELPESGDNLVWLMQDTFNVKPEVAQIRLCAGMSNITKSAYNQWLID